MSPTTTTRAIVPQASSSTITLMPRPRSIKKPAKRVSSPRVRIDIPPHHPITVSGLNSEISPLTPTSSPLERRNVQEFPQLSPEPTPIASSSQTSKKPTKTDSPCKRAHKSSSLATLDLCKVGARVWVLIDHRARILEPGDIGEIKSQKDWIWWPGKVVSLKPTARPLRVALANSSGFDVKHVEIFDPCELNIVSWLNSAGQIRYEEPVFANHFSDGVHASPRKKQKADKEGLKRRWRLAVKELDNTAPNELPSPKKPPASTNKAKAPRPSSSSEADDHYDSDLPEVGTQEFRTYPPSTSSSPVKGAAVPISSQRNLKRKRSSSLDAIEVVAPRWSPRPPDISITIPGELILAMERASDSIYWPARVLDYIPADKPMKLDKYRVEFLDGKTQFIPRHWFYIAEEDKFATCKLGEWDSTVVEVRNDDEDNFLEQEGELGRFQSPPPIVPPPSAEDFKLLSVREQFAYAKPVLSAILNERFSPALQRHRDFIVGGSKRKNVVEEAGFRGQMDPRDVDVLQRYVTGWCLRDEQWAQVITDEEDSFVPLGQDIVELDDCDPCINRSVSPTPTDISSGAELPPSSFVTSLEKNFSITHLHVNTNVPRQYGCEAFESLSRSEKNDYCLNVLLPETILQILLWRTGERTSLDLLEDAEEASLHAKGLELLRASDWVNDVMRLRMATIGQLGKSNRNNTDKGRAKNDDGEILYSITGRPRRTVGAPKSYLE